MLSLVPGNERPHTGLTGQFDHVIAYCGTAGLLGLGYPTTKVRFEIVAMLALLAAVLEVAQLWVPGRHSQFIDFAMSSGGACFGMLAAAIADSIGLWRPARALNQLPLFSLLPLVRPAAGRVSGAELYSATACENGRVPFMSHL